MVLVPRAGCPFNSANVYGMKRKREIYMKSFCKYRIAEHLSAHREARSRRRIGQITGVLIGKILVILHFPPARRNPPPYSHSVYSIYCS